jgi:hypothetical protein
MAGLLPEGGKGKAVLFRLDSGNDREKTVEALLGEDDQAAKKAGKEGRKIIIKRNLRQESKEIWLDLAQEEGKGEEMRKEKMRYMSRHGLKLTHEGSKDERCGTIQRGV